MLVNQIAVFLENKEGKINQFAQIMGENHINILTMSIADTAEYGILRCITDDNDKAIAVLKTYGFNVVSTDLIGFEVPHDAGELSKVLNVLDQNNVNISYMYSYGSVKDNKALIVMKVKDNEETLKVLRENGINISTGSIIY